MCALFDSDKACRDVAVQTIISCAHMWRAKADTYESTNLSLLTHSGFLGLKVMNLLKRTWAEGARPMGAPGWPEFALNVASTWKKEAVSNWIHWGSNYR